MRERERERGLGPELLDRPKRTSSPLPRLFWTLSEGSWGVAEGLQAKLLLT